MPDKVFVDTNLWIYLFLKSARRPVSSIIFGSLRIPVSGVANHGNSQRALFSEDLQDGQTLEGTLTIRNPFKKYHENAHKAGAKCDKNASEQTDGK